MKKNIIIILFISYKAFGAPIDSQIENPNRVLDLIQKQKEQNYINEQLKYPDKYKISQDKNEIEKFSDNKEYIFDDISIIGSSKIPNPVKKILKKYENIPITKQDIFKLIQEVSDYYIKKGYVTTLVTLKSGNIKTKKLVLEIKFGYINDIYIKNSKFSKLRVFDAFPTKKDKKLNIYALDQGLENLNNGGYVYTLDVEPSTKLDFSDVIINEQKNSTGITIGVNNSSTTEENSIRSVLGFSQYDLLGINDTLSLTYMDRFKKDRKRFFN